MNLISSGVFNLPRGGHFLATDVTLGVPGLPQSATGQTTLFTGVNAARIVGRHLQGFPNSRLRQLVSDHSLFRKLTSLGRTATFANVYTPQFFEKRPRWVSVTTVMCETAGVPLRRFVDLKEAKGLFMDFSNRLLVDRGFDLGIRSSSRSAQILIDLASGFDLCLYEFFLTDLLGHRGSIREAAALLAELDDFLDHVVHGIDLGTTSLVITSDHGNIEDMSTSRHTRNRVPTLVWGEIGELFTDTADLHLDGITPRIVRFLS